MSKVVGAIMKLKLIIFVTMLFAGKTFSSQHQKIDTIGMSPKGQFIALEEYGYQSENHTYFATIKIMNIWKKEYVGSTIQVELPAHRPKVLDLAREQAKKMAKGELEKFNISG